MKEKKVMTKKQCREIAIAEWQKTLENDDVAIAALLRLYSYQTPDEKKEEDTIELNGHGFTYADAVFLTSIAKSYIKYNRLTEKQLTTIKKALRKYHRQFIGF